MHCCCCSPCVALSASCRRVWLSFPGRERVFSDKSRLIKGCFVLFFSLGSAGITRFLISSIIRGNWKLPEHGASVTLSSDCKKCLPSAPDWRDVFSLKRGIASRHTGKTSQTTQAVQRMPKALMAFQPNRVASLRSIFSHLAPSLVLLKTIKKTFPLFTRASKSYGGLPAQPTTAVVPCVGCNFSNSIGPPSRLPRAPPHVPPPTPQLT